MCYRYNIGWVIYGSESESTYVRVCIENEGHSNNCECDALGKAKKITGFFCPIKR